MPTVADEQSPNRADDVIDTDDGDETMQASPLKTEEDEGATQQQQQDNMTTDDDGDQHFTQDTNNASSDTKSEDLLLPIASREKVLAKLTIVHDYTVPVPETVHGSSRHLTEKNRMMVIGRSSQEEESFGETINNIHPSQFLGIEIIPTRDVQQLDMPKKRGRKKKVIPQVAVPRQTAISKQHCSVMYDQMKQVFIILNHGRNGTWVNNLLLTNAEPSVAELRDGDVIRLVDQASPTYILFEIEDEDLKKRFA